MEDKVKQIIDKINKDVEVVKDVSSGSDAYTYFVKKDDKYFYRKIAVAQTGGVEKLKMQLDFLFKYGQVLQMAEIGAYACNQEFCYYDMLASKEHQNFFSYLKNADSTEAWSILQNILTLLQDFHKKNSTQPNLQNLNKYIQTKIFDNANKIMQNGGEYIARLQDYDTIIINGKSYNNLAYYFGSNGIFDEQKLLQIFAGDKCSLIHGDFTIDNIIYDKNSANKAYLIDPNVGNMHESSFLDFAKMLQSLHGNYEYYKHANDLNIWGNIITYDIGNTKQYKQIYAAYDQFLRQNFTGNEYKSIYTHELVHWLRLMPYKIRKDPKVAVLFYCQLVIELNEYERMFLKQQTCSIDKDLTSERQR